jgi:hypothetical protein
MKRISILSLTPVFAFLMGLIVSGGSQAHDPQGQRHMGQGYGMGHGYGYGMAPDPRYHMGPGMMGPGYGMGHGQHLGQGMMGPRYHMGPGQGMGPGMMGPGMMGPGYGMGHGYGMHRALPRDLTPDDVRHMLGHQLEWQGIKLGKVEEKDEDTIVAEIVTNDGSLVDRFEVDRHTGRMRRAY